MKTINELGIYFMCCFIFATLFITYLAVKLRAYRIKNARLDTRNENLQYSLNCVNRSYNTYRTESAAIINQSAENNAKLIAEIEHLKQSYQSGSAATVLFYETQIETLKSDRQKLFDIAKGATAKLAEMNVALEGLEVKEEKKENDWIEDASTINFKHNEGRMFECLMDEGDICSGKIEKWGNYPHAYDGDTAWYFDLNSDGTFIDAQVFNKRFRWID